MTLNIKLKPKKKVDLVRVGRKNDGGYLVAKKSLVNSKNLISYGINDDWSFEKDFLRKNKKVNLKAVDDNLSFTFLLKRLVMNFFWIFSLRKKSNFLYSIYNLIDYLFSFNKHIIKKTVFYGDTKNISTNLNDIFFKIDIEGSEYRVLNELLEIQDKIEGLVIEFHYVDILSEKIVEFINNFDLELVHIHPNNYGKKDFLGDPVSIELTFARNFDIIDGEVEIPNELDMKNNPDADEIILKFN